MSFVDSHCHIYEDEIIIEEALKNNVNILISSGCDEKSNLKVLQLIEKYDNVYGCIGYHPSEVKNISDNNLSLLKKQCDNPKIIAIGEIGLDYYYGKENKFNQIKMFKKQLELATILKKPIVVHSRDAAKDTYDLLKEFKLTGSIHCFSYGVDMAKQFVKLGYHLGITGVVTFKNSEKLKKVVKEIPLDKLLLETDSPYLTPIPYRGKTNYPKYIPFIAKEIARIKQIDVEMVGFKTTKNIINLFNI
ncbi:MAG: TatD family hydrolase [Bacilli bacterium]